MSGFKMTFFGKINQNLTFLRKNAVKTRQTNENKNIL